MPKVRETVTKLCYVRKMRGLTQQQVADKTGISLKTLQKYESGSLAIEKAAVDKVCALCKLYNCGIRDITSLDYVAPKTGVKFPEGVGVKKDET